MDIDASSLVAGFLVSGAGYVLFSYGRKMGRPPHVVTGIVLLVYPYFVPSVPLMLGLGALFGGALWLAVRFGY